jgi:fatty-acid desaturase
MDHRAHHRYTDTDKDPYNVKKGFLWAHIGWVIWKRPQSEYQDKGCNEVGINNVHNIDISDLILVTSLKNVFLILLGSHPPIPTQILPTPRRYFWSPPSLLHSWLLLG